MYYLALSFTIFCIAFAVCIVGLVSRFALFCTIVCLRIVRGECIRIQYRSYGRESCLCARTNRSKRWSWPSKTLQRRGDCNASSCTVAGRCSHARGRATQRPATQGPVDAGPWCACDDTDDDDLDGVVLARQGRATGGPADARLVTVPMRDGRGRVAVASVGVAGVGFDGVVVVVVVVR